MKIRSSILMKFIHAGIILFASLSWMSSALAGPSDRNSVSDGFYTSPGNPDTIICEPIDINLVPKDYQHISKDTLIACIYDTITFQSGYSGEVAFKYHWYNGSSNPELKLFTTGVGIDVQKIWLDLIDLQTGCIYTDTMMVVFNFGTCVGINETVTERQIRFFPNPARHVLFIDYTDNQDPLQLLLYNFNGQLVYQEQTDGKHPGNGQIQIDLKSLPRGMYIISFIHGHTRSNEKIVLN